ncbi:hypothetical protein [Paenibacillus elgii]|uniref:hypothetical protein n=1 Tax=Paenibacillus elgii TaxID=189691 RepID=UPI00203F952B|nr:hypothetical protein [Paenibacillus elgii]MCM3268813.1 hypothetical protein [Paenibacillus elgii]
MGLYEELSARKANGVRLLLEDLSVDDLRRMFIDEQIFDWKIADLYDVKKSKIAYLRKKHGITIRSSILNDFLSGKTEQAIEMNIQAKNEMLCSQNINMISKAITHFAFRNGPIEDMHAHPNNQLSESDMKTLNKFMVNRIAYIFTLIIEERWLEFEFLVKTTDSMFGHGWDEAEPDDGDTRKILEMMLKRSRTN